MPTSTDINLPKSHKAIFPDRCVACGVGSPGGTYRVGTNAIGWWTLAFWSFGGRFTVDAPACERCRARMRRQWWLRLVVMLVYIAAAVVVAGTLMRSYQGPFKGWLRMGVALLFLVPLCLWEAFAPRPFDLTAFSTTVDYEFRDPDYATEFAILNVVAMQESGGGEPTAPATGAEASDHHAA